MQGYGTVRTLEAQEVDSGSHAPLRECTIADCGELPADADLAGMRTWVPEVRVKPSIPNIKDTSGREGERPQSMGA